MTYSKAQLEALWASTNPGNGDPHLMAAIALAESGGNPSAGNFCCHGLWQVNTLVHPYTIAQMQNPLANAKAAGSILKSQGLGAWETYTNGAYKQFYTGPTTHDAAFGIPFTPEIPGEEQAKELLGGGIGGTGIPNPLSALGALGKIPGDFDKIYKLLFTPEGWLKIGKVILGVFLLMTGVLGMANVSTPEAGTLVERGKKAAELVAVAAA